MKKFRPIIIYPFILFNLLFLTQAANAEPIIMISQNRQNEYDRLHTEADYKTNEDVKHGIEAIIIKLKSIEMDKYDKIIELHQDRSNNSPRKSICWFFWYTRRGSMCTRRLALKLSKCMNYVIFLKNNVTLVSL